MFIMSLMTDRGARRAEAAAPSRARVQPDQAHRGAARARLARDARAQQQPDLQVHLTYLLNYLLILTT